MGLDRAGVAEVTVECRVRFVLLSVLVTKGVKVAEAVVSDELRSVMTVPFKNDTFSVEVKVMVVVLSKVEVAEEL